MQGLEKVAGCAGQIAGTHLLNQSGYDLAVQAVEKATSAFDVITHETWQSVAQKYLSELIGTGPLGPGTAISKIGSMFIRLMTKKA